MSTTYSFCITETFYPLNNNFPQPVATTILLLHTISFSPFNNLVKRDIHSFSRRDEGYLQGKGKVGSGLWRMNSAEQVELERQHVQREDIGCSRKGGATLAKQLLVKLAQKEHGRKEQKAGGLQGRAQAFGPCSVSRGCS